MDEIEFIAASTLCLVTIYNCMVMLNEENIRVLNQNYPVNQNEPSLNRNKQLIKNENKQLKLIKNKEMRKTNINNNLQVIERKQRKIASGDCNKGEQLRQILNEKRRRRIEHEDRNLLQKMIKINRSRMKNDIGKIVPKKRRIRRFWTMEAYQRSK